MECCDPRGYNKMFGPRFARRLARRYHKRGLDRTASTMVDFLAARGIEGATVLEVGGGVGDIQLELLQRGARHTTNLELSPAYEEEALRLTTEAGVTNRVSRRLVDIAARPDAVEPADIVVLHRVVCCYPDYERLLTAAAAHARRLLVFSHPPLNVASRMIFGAENTMFRIARMEFRTFNHPPSAMLATLSRAGLQPTYAEAIRMWRVVGLERRSA